jgi:hypothetical protein
MTSTIVISVLCAIIGTSFATLFIPWLVRQTRERIEAQNRFAKAMEGLTETVGILKDIPKMIAGHAAAAGAMAISVDKIRDSVEKFAALVTKPEDDDRKKVAFIEYPKEENADKQFLVSELWAAELSKGNTPSAERIEQMAQEQLDKQASQPYVAFE